MLLTESARLKSVFCHRNRTVKSARKLYAPSAGFNTSLRLVFVSPFLFPFIQHILKGFLIRRDNSLGKEGTLILDCFHEDPGHVRMTISLIPFRGQARIHLIFRYTSRRVFQPMSGKSNLTHACVSNNCWVYPKTILSSFPAKE